MTNATGQSRVTRKRPTISDLSDRLRHALYAREQHSSDCLLWDYEGSDCPDCIDHDDRVKLARRTLKSAQARLA